MKTLLITLLITLGLKNSEINFQQAQNQDKGMHASWNVLLQQYVDVDGNVDYRSWKKSQTDLDKYIQLLEKTPPASYWDKNDSLAYFINAYNAVTVKLILDNYPLKSIRDIKDPWGSKSLNLPNNSLTLNDIEHKVLRKMDDPRIHFAINCASASCPQLSNEAFRASKVQKQLDEATALFINDKSKNQISEKNIGLSKIFLWFSKDFGSKKERISFIQKYSQKPLKDKAKIKYQEYDWSLNE